MTASVWREVPASEVKAGQRVRLHLSDNPRRSDTVVTATAMQSDDSVWVGDYRTDISADTRRYEVELPPLPTEPGTVIDAEVGTDGRAIVVLTAEAAHEWHGVWMDRNQGGARFTGNRITDWTLVAPAPGGEA